MNSSEMLVNFYQITQCHIPEDSYPSGKVKFLLCPSTSAKRMGAVEVKYSRSLY
jgi:hypothetical protein